MNPFALSRATQSINGLRTRRTITITRVCEWIANYPIGVASELQGAHVGSPDDALTHMTGVAV